MHTVLREKGLSEGAVLTAIRLALVIHGLATVLDVEQVNAPQLVRAYPCGS
jgi:hypothetical protein